MGKKIMGSLLLGIVGAGYAYLYNIVGDAHRGLFVFASLLAVFGFNSTRKG